MPAPGSARILRARYPILTIWAGVLLALVLTHPQGPGGDALYFREGFALLVHGGYDEPHRFITIHHSGGGLQLYAKHPTIQIGPLALLISGAEQAVSAFGTWFVPVVTTGLGLGALRAVEVLADRYTPGRRESLHRLILTAGPFLMYAWVQAFVLWRHVDDMLVLLGVIGAMFSILHRKPWLLGITIGLAGAAKPTALAFLPLLFAFDLRDNLKAIGTASALLTACWLPFLIGEPATLHAGVPQMTVAQSSGLTVLGFSVYSTPPHLTRVVQMGVVLAAGAVAMRRGRWYLVPLIGFGLRAALDPAVVSYYAVSIIVGAVIADALPRPKSPITTVVAWLAFSEPFAWPWLGSWPAPSPGHQAWMRLGVPLVLTVVLLVRRDREPRRPRPFAGTTSSNGPSINSCVMSITG